MGPWRSSRVAAITGITADDIGVGPMPGPSETPSATIGGAALYITRDLGDAEAAGAWDYIKFLVTAEAQSFWAAESGYAPVRTDATEIEPLVSIYADDPRFRVPYDQVNFDGRRLHRPRSRARADAPGSPGHRPDDGGDLRGRGRPDVADRRR